MSSSSGLSLEGKVGQLLMSSFNNADELEGIFRNSSIGSVILYKKNLGTPKEIQHLCGHIQKMALHYTGLPCIISIDQEGGRVTRLEGEGFTEFPSNRSVTQTNDSSLAKRCALAIGKEMRSVGITMNLAPVCDVNTNPFNPVIGPRSFGDNATVVTEFAFQAIEGYHESKVLTCLKHFPGHGDTHEDSHFDLPAVNKDIASLESIELMPFMSLADHTDAIMSAHILLPKLDSKTCATLSQPILSRLRTAGYKQLIISDSLTMKGVLKLIPKEDITRAAIQALTAGCDILCLDESEPEVVKEIHEAIVKAVREEILSIKKIDASIDRIYRAKFRFSLPDFSEVPDLKNHTALVREIAQKAFTIIKTPINFSMKNKKIYLFYSSLIQNVVEKTTLFSDFNIVGLATEKNASCVEYAKEADLCLWILHNAFIDKSLQRFLTSTVQESSVLTALLTVGSSYDSDYFFSFKHVTFIANTYSPTSEALNVALQSM